ncbi:unnamed protein product [Phaedon cochleariae]|uniref:Uncharacterized protein n=1 Tax=Phaedon cochleariae TaxID=80249 RepID=A0A9N9SNQ0_PHACE|nr:unnamed protein product [Phaedon cochleariae]
MLYLVIILTLFIDGSKETCPTICQCNYHSTDDPTLRYTSIRCHSYTDNITSLFENTTRQLEISNIDDESFSALLSDITDLKSELPFLSDLTISSSELIHMNASAETSKWIRSLTLIDNELRDLPGLFTNLSALETLDLSRNGMNTIETESFRTLRALIILNISSNGLESISDDGLNGLRNLKCLDLSKNNLTLLADSSFHDLSSLQYLNLSNNHLRVLNDTSFVGLVQLQQLDLSWNILSQVDPGSLQLPCLTRLLLTGNTQLGKARDAAVLVGTGRKLQTVDAARTGLKQVPAALTPSIRSLRLADNGIRSVNCGDLDSYPLLQLLDLTGNELDAVEEDALGRLESLAVLYLTDNNICEVPRSLPENLKALHLEHNEIEKVSCRDLQGLADLEVLALSDNKISMIEEGAFGQSVSLASLDLSRNPLVILPPGSLTGPRALQVLRLSFMRVVSPSGDNNFPLSTPDRLVTLDLSDSPGLARQLLADTATLAASKQLQELDVSGTNLESVRSDLLHFLPQLRTLHIKRNRLNCSQLHWLGTWLRRLDEHEYRDVLCASPPQMWGIPLIDIQVEESTTVDDVTKSPQVAERRSWKTISKRIVAVPQQNDLFKNKAVQASNMVDKMLNGINETGKVTITETSTPLELGELSTQNANETVRSNRAHQLGLPSRDLFIAHEEETFNDPVGAEKRNGESKTASERSIDLAPQEDVPAGEMSKYTNDKGSDRLLLHPGLLILAVGVAVAVACVATLAVRFVRNRRSYRQEDIEVTSLPTISDLW